MSFAIQRPCKQRPGHLTWPVKQTLCALASVLACTLTLTLTPDAWARSASKGPITLSLIALNDFHGSLVPPAGSLTMTDPGNPAGARVAAGGAAYLSTLVHDLKRQNPNNTLVIADGDMIGASPLASSLFHDEPTIDFLNQIGLTISSVGNHEFDKGKDELLRMQKGGCHPKSKDAGAGMVGVDTCMTQGRFSGAKFEYLAANVIDQSTGKTLFPPYAIRVLGGVRVGFIGLTLKDTPAMVTPAGVAGLQFADEVETINRLVPVLKRDGATVIVVLLHQGGEARAKTVPDKSCSAFSGDIIDLSDRMDAGVDVVVSGHTHQEYVCFRPDGKLVTQAGSNGRMVTKIDLTIHRLTKKVIAKDANNIVVINDLQGKDPSGRSSPLPTAHVALRPDPAVDQFVRRYAELSASIANVEIGRLTQPLDRKTNPAGESALGAVIADAFLAGSSDASYGDKPSQIAFTNPGGIRADLNASLLVTFGQLFSVMPFNNNLVAMDLTGAQLLRLLEQQWESPQKPGGRILSVSDGFSYTWDASMPEAAMPGAGRRVVAGSMQLHGVPIEMEQTYRVTVNNFLASGGDNFTLLLQGKNQQAGEIDSVVAKQYFHLKGSVGAPTMSRISRLN